MTAPPGDWLQRMRRRPGVFIGEICRAIYELQLDGTVTTHEEALNAAKTYVANKLLGPG